MMSGYSTSGKLWMLYNIKQDVGIQYDMIQ